MATAVVKYLLIFSLHATLGTTHGDKVPQWDWFPLCCLYLLRLRHYLWLLENEKRLFLLFVSLHIFSLIFPSASPRHTEVGFLMHGSCAGNDNYKTKWRLSACISSGQDQQRPPKWFKVTVFGSIVYLIKKWPIQPHTTCLVLFVAWLLAKASLNRPCVSYCGGRHLSTDCFILQVFF